VVQPVKTWTDSLTGSITGPGFKTMTKTTRCLPRFSTCATVARRRVKWHDNGPGPGETADSGVPPGPIRGVLWESGGPKREPLIGRFLLVRCERLTAYQTRPRTFRNAFRPKAWLHARAAFLDGEYSSGIRKEPYVFVRKPGHQAQNHKASRRGL
jgi:hypothetical protein